MKRISGLVVISSCAWLLSACGGGGSSGSSKEPGTTLSPPAITTQKTIASSDDAGKTVKAATTMATSFASGSSFPSLDSLVQKKPAGQSADGHRILSTVLELKQNLAEITSRHKALGKRLAAVESSPCSDGGSMSYNPQSDPVIVTFVNCKDNYEYWNGTVTMPKSLYDGIETPSGTIAAKLTTINYSFGGYSNKEYESSSNFTMYFESIGTSGSTTREQLIIDGTNSEIDYREGTSERQSFEDFSLDIEMNEGSVTTSIAMTLDGAFSMDTFRDTQFSSAQRVTASAMSFEDFWMYEVANESTTSLEISGKYAMATIPSCMDGTFDITTQTPIMMDNISGVTRSGKMKVNGVDITFNANGSVTATLNGVPQNIDYTDYCSTLEF